MRSGHSFTLESLRSDLLKIRGRWIPTGRPGNDGGIGNTLEDLLGIKENNVPTADAGEFEIKSHNRASTSLITLLHQDPWPRVMGSPVQRLLLPKYGWAHETIPNEMSFRQTIRGDRYTDRGFAVEVDRTRLQISVRFDSSRVSPVHHEWLDSVERRVGLSPLDPAPFWPFDKLKPKLDGKLPNLLYVVADVRRTSGRVEFYYDEVTALRDYTFERFLTALEHGYIYVDFDARTHHNHGTKMRMKDASWPELYNIRERLL